MNNPCIPLTLLAAQSIFVKANMVAKAGTSRVDHMFRAFSDQTRLRILHMLRGGELCVCDIVDVLRVPQPKASRHLAYLRKVGLVSVRKEGLWSYYTLAPARSEFHQKLLDCLASCFSSVPALARDAERLGRPRCSPAGDATACCE
jgi:ArsR family transcriptional regulator